MSQDDPRSRDRAAQPTELVSGEVDWGMKLESGSVLGDRYRIKALLGVGGMGEVWHAFDLKLRVEVALKALRPEFFSSERRLELLRDEVRALWDAEETTRRLTEEAPYCGLVGSVVLDHRRRRSTRGRPVAPT